MTTRLELQTKLEEILGSNKVYFQPPSGFQLKFPCIVYELSTINGKMANNNKYKLTDRYKITYITQEADDALTKKILTELPKSVLNVVFKTEGLYHYNYELFLD